MELSIVGSGYVGTTIAACFAELGHEVTNIDIDQEIVRQINNKEPPIHEPGLAAFIDEYAGNRLTATTEYAAIQDTSVTFLALPTPARSNGGIDTTIVEEGARTLGTVLSQIPRQHLVVVKSTVIPGTTDERLIPQLEESSGASEGTEFDVAVNPEFLREGTAVNDFMNPDKLVFGGRHDRVTEKLRAVYKPLIERSQPAVIETGLREAELIKYANNAFLAAKVSLINELGNIAKEYGVDAYEVAEAIGTDHRISEHFLRSGVGWGGSCFPKDLSALIAAARDRGYEPSMLQSAVDVNNEQPHRLLSLLDRHIDVSGKRVAVLGLAFKPGTDDIRNSRSILVIEGLLERGAKIVAYDPVAGPNMQEIFPEIDYVSSPVAALTEASGAVIVTEWEEFADLDDEFDLMVEPIVVDGRHVIERRTGITYEGLTW